VHKLSVDTGDYRVYCGGVGGATQLLPSNRPNEGGRIGTPKQPGKPIYNRPRFCYEFVRFKDG